MFDRNRLLRGAWLAVALLGLGFTSPPASADSAIYGGGPFYSGGQAVMDDLRASGFTTVILFAVHVHANGDLHYNNVPIISNGTYIGDPGWPSRLATLKQAPTSVIRIEASVGGWGTGDFQNIKDLIAAQGTGPDSALYRNFQTLKQITGADAIDFDDETTYDLASSTLFGNMLWDLGYSITLAPYTSMSYWQSLANNLSGKVDGIHLQVYAGGAGNDPATWSNALGMAVDPGLWSKHGTGCTSGDSPASVQSRMGGWKTSAGIVGGFIWLYDDIQACWPQGTTTDYASAINAAVGGNPPPAVNLALNRPATGSTACNASESPDRAVNGSVTGGNGDKFCTLASSKWLQVDLGAAQAIGRFVIDHAGAGGESTAWNTRAYDIRVSSDGSTWTTVASVSDNAASTSSHDVPPIAARYVRLDIATPAQNGDPAARIYEFEVY